jgi:hypothetical protein
MPTILTTGNLNVPNQILDPWLGSVQHGSSVATLSDSIPMKFGAGQSMTFDIGEAEFVGEGANKGPSNIVPTVKTVKPFKFHKTVRWTEEVLWADEDHQLGVVQEILNLIQPALSRALDYGVYHGINPASGAAVAAMDQRLTNTTNVVTRPGTGALKPFTYLDSADTLVLTANAVPRDAAIDPSFASGFSTARGTNSEAKLYPNFTLSTAASELDGHRTSVSKTVRAVGVASTATNVLAFVGDFSAIRWGIQRQIGLEVIRFGDPDGQGDLKRNNQVAFRAEVVYGWGIADLTAFAKIVQA